MHALDPIHLANGLSGFAFVALGAWVLSARRDAVSVAFATYAFSWAATVMVVNLLVEVGHGGLLEIVATTVLSFVVVGALAVLVGLYPKRASRADAAAGAAACLAGAATLLGPAIPGAFTGTLGTVYDVGFFGFKAAYWAVLVFLALRWRALDEAARRSVVLVSAALVVWQAFVVGDAAAADDVTSARGTGVADVVAVFALAAIWLWNSARAGDRGARAVAWATLGAMLVGMLERATFPTAPDLWGYGVARLLGVAILAYAIVRHQLLGIDVKVRWTISKSTVAAAFIAVFFVASEGAQLLFGADNPYVGLLAAGALVFAMAPLQRAADRLAERAVPVAQAATAPVDRREAAYRVAVRKFLADGRLTREEEVALAELATALGVTPVRALEIRHEAEAAVAA